MVFFRENYEPLSISDTMDEIRNSSVLIGWTKVIVFADKDEEVYSENEHDWYAQR